MTSPRMPEIGSRMAAAITGIRYSLSENSPTATSHSSTLLTNSHCAASPRSQSVSGVQHSHSSNIAPTSAIRKGSSTANSMLGWHCDTSARLKARATPAILDDEMPGAAAAVARVGRGMVRLHGEV